MKRPVIVGLSALAATLLTAAVARSQPSASIADALDVGPSQCLDRETLAQHVQMWLGTADKAIDVQIEVRDEPNGVRFVVRRAEKTLGERTLDVREVACQQIHAAVGLGIASSIDATVLSSIGVVEPEPVPMAPAPPLPPPAASPPPQPLPVVRPPIKEPEEEGPVLTATVQGMVLVGLLPEVELGVSPSIDLTLVRGFDVRASAFVTTAATVEVGDGTASAGLVGGRFEACAAVILKRDLARVRGCAGILAGAVAAEGNDFVDPRTATAAWVGPTARVDARWSFSEVFGMMVAIDGYLPGLKPELEVVDLDGNTVDAEPFPLAGVGVALGPSITF